MAETIAEYLQMDGDGLGDSPTPSVSPGANITEVHSLKASFEQEQLGQAVLLYSPDPAVRKAPKRVWGN